MEIRSAHDIWEAALGELQVQVSKSNYRTWFEKTEGLSYQENRFIVSVPNTFVAEYLDRNQRSLIEKALIGLTSSDVQVCFQVNGRNHNEEYPGAVSTAVIPLLGLPRFNTRYSFDTFIEGESNRFARSAALAVAQNPGQSYNPLFIYSGVGMGKTHLLHAIGQMVSLNRLPVICVSAEQFTTDFVTSLRERRVEEFRSRYRSAAVLLIDDVHFICGKEQTEESFFHVFNELHNENRQIVLTSDRPPRALTQMDERLRSRFEWGLVLQLPPPDVQTRQAILRAKCAADGFPMDDRVLEYISGRVQNSIRELEGAVNRVTAYAKLLRAQPTLEIAARALKDVSVQEDRSVITPVQIITAVADSFKMTPEDLKGAKRDKETVLARRVAMYLIRKETGCSLSQIGNELGGRDAAAVTNSCKKVAKDIEEDSFLKRKESDIRQKLHPLTEAEKAARN